MFGPVIRNFEYEASRDVFGFVGAIIAFRSARQLLQPQTRLARGTRLFDIRDGATLIRVRIDDILAVTSAGNYVEFALRDGRRPLMRKPLSTMEAELAADGFVRVHRSWLVNAMQVTGLKPEGSGDYAVEIGTLTVPLSRRFPDALARLRADETGPWASSPGPANRWPAMTTFDLAETVARYFRSASPSTCSPAMTSNSSILRANHVVGSHDLTGVKVGADFAENVVMAGFAKIGLNDGFGVFLHLGTPVPHFAGCPFAEQPVAASHDLEAQLLVMGPFGLRRPAPVLERSTHPQAPE